MKSIYKIFFPVSIVAFFSNTAGSDYANLAPFQVTFGPGSVGNVTTQSVVIEIIGDTIGEMDETFLLCVMPAMPEYDDGFKIMLTILNDDRKFSESYSLQTFKLIIINWQVKLA